MNDDLGNVTQSVALLLKCIDFISDTLLITEATPLAQPGPRVVFVNRAFERMTGYAASEIVGQTPRMLQGPKTDRAELRRVRTALEKWLPVRAEFINYKKNGDEFVVEMDIVPVGDGTGQWTHWVSIQRDVTNRKTEENEARAREAQRYESLGTLSAGIAHDFNNIIAAILGNTAVGNLDMQAGQMPRASLEQINKAALRARSVVAKILAYSRRRSEATTPVQLAPIITEATDLLRAILPSDVKLEVNCPPDPIWVRGDASQLCQVLLNLGVNAMQSLSATPGQIRFELEAPGNSSDLLTPSPRIACVEVSDTGRGMDAATRARMFEPYFTTKQGGRGTGLGLSMVWGIVSAHGGLIAVQSTLGRGTRVKVSLPIIEDLALAAPTPEATSTGAVGNGEHVLVVDDDEVVIVMLEAMLQRWNYRVTALQDPLRALEILQHSANDVDIVVTDLNMPEMSGLQLARAVLAVRADMPVIMGSGTVSEEILAAASHEGISAVFAKEFAVEQLGTLLQRALSRTLPPIESPPELESQSALPTPPHRQARMHGFLKNNYDDLLKRCKAKVAERPHRKPSDAQLANGIPLVLDQLIRTLVAEEAGQVQQGLQISGASGGVMSGNSEIGVAATAHGKQLLELGYTVDQVVHDYGDLCQAITDLAVERDAPFSIDSYRTLNRCLDNAIANAVTEFAAQREMAIGAAQTLAENRRVGLLSHELRTFLNVALMAFEALETGPLVVTGATGRTLKHNLLRLDKMIGQAPVQSQSSRPVAASAPRYSLAEVIAEAADVGTLYAAGAGCTLITSVVDPALAINGSRELLMAALTNVLQNAFKFTKPDTEVTLMASEAEGRVFIQVKDQDLQIAEPFEQDASPASPKNSKRWLGLGLAVAEQATKAAGGFLTVRDVTGQGCVFTIELPAAVS